MSTTKTPTRTPGLPEIKRGMRLEWRVRDASSAEKPGCRAHSRCLVAADGSEIATIANDAADAARAAISKAEGRA